MARGNDKKFTKTEKSWILYDWANSVYATNMLAAIFPLYFASVCQAHGADNLVLWSYGTSAATFLVAILAPILGALGDHKGHKKKLFAGFLLLGVAFTLFNAFTGTFAGRLCCFSHRLLRFLPVLRFLPYRCDYPGAHGSCVLLGLCHGLHWRQHHSLFDLHCDTGSDGHG